MDITKILESEISRRSLFIDAAKVAAGAAGVIALGGGIGLPSTALAKGGTTEKWPWPYVKLDPEKTAELAYNEWYRVFCGCAVVSSVFSQLREKVGEPYTSFPIDAFMFLEGGVAGWGTICGSVAGANIVSNVIIGPRINGPECENGALIGSEMLEWYSDSQLPIYNPKKPKIAAKIIQTKSESPLCHVSVGKWMAKSGFPLPSPERKDRCARVTASVAYKLVEHLNAWKDGKYETGATWFSGKDVGITAQQNCTECHGTKVPSPPLAKR
jgi:hypothetical protein